MWLHRRAAHLLLLIPVLGMPLLARGQTSGGMGMVPGEPCATPVPVMSGAPSALADVAGTLFFAMSDADGLALWKTDGTTTAKLKGGRAVWADNAKLERFTAVGNRLFFTVFTTTGHTELWTSAGTAESTKSLKSFLDSGLGGQSEFVAVGNRLFFTANDDTHGYELWWSEGEPWNTVRMKEIVPTFTGSSPWGLTEMNGQLFFVSHDGVGDVLWRLSGWADVQSVAYINMSTTPGSSLASSLTVMGGELYFTATNGASVTLWKSDGMTAPQEVAPNALAASVEAPRDLTVAGTKLFFRFKNATSGAEVWVSDGTELNTHLVKEIASKDIDSDPQQLTAVGETLYFLANDGQSGQEPWRSDGTEQGTSLVRDFIPNSGSPFQPKLVSGPGVLLAQIEDPVWGSELWKIDAVGAARLTDIAAQSASSLPRLMTISGSKLFFVARDASSASSLYVLPLNEVDCFAPVLTCPPDQEVEAISSQGAFFSSLPYHVFDDAVAAPRTTVSSALEGVFPIGDTAISLTARDAAGNSSQACSFHINVRDTTPPLLLCPDAVVQEATGPSGAVANYFVVASDAVSKPAVSYSRPSGAVFPVGETWVDVSASDGVNNSLPCQFPVTIRDTVPPKLTCPKDIVLQATTAEPIPINYVYTATDVATPTPELLTEHPPGSLFPVGDTRVDLTVRDAVGNTASCGFWVRNVDPEPPTITCPGPQRVVASKPEGAVVRFPAAAATDNLGSVEVSYSQEQGSTFPVGETIVTATATDAGQHSASCTFTVTVGEYIASDGGCQAGASGGALGWLLLVLMPVWARRRAARVEG